MCDINADQYWKSNSLRGKILLSLDNFLRDQHFLQKFDISNARFSINDGIKILEAFTTGLSGRRKLKVLNLEDFFNDNLMVFQVGKFLHCLRGIRQLHSLYINYNCLSDDAMKILTRNCGTTLKFLSIKVCGCAPHFHEIDPMIWRELIKACPGLKVDIYFTYIGDYASIRSVLCHPIPLHSLHIKGGTHNPGEMWNIPETIQYIGDVFNTSLSKLCMHIFLYLSHNYKLNYSGQ